MQIVRVKKIQNIGTYKNFTTGGPLGFEKFTCIYGLNCAGKSTLTDIFLSLKYDNNTFITTRKSIPSISDPQRVELCCKVHQTGTETDITFQSLSWNSNTLSEHLEIFDTGFINRNVFTGFLIERQNKVNFTQFILGEQGVQLANTISEKKSTLGKNKKDIKEKIPDFVKLSSSDEIDQFVQLDIASFDITQLTQERDHLISKRNTLQERLKYPEQIAGLPLPNIYNPTSIDVSLFERINIVNRF